MSEEKDRSEEIKKKEEIHVPLHLKHRPILGLEQYEQADGHKAGNSEAKGLSIGLAQWNSDETSEVSAKIWRHTGEKWSRQSEEMALHRIVDLTILIARTRLLFKRFKPTKLKEKPGYPLIDELNLQGESLPVSACVESETFEDDVVQFEKAMTKEEMILKDRFSVLTEILLETDKVIREKSEKDLRSETQFLGEERVHGSEEVTVSNDFSSGGERRWFKRISLKDLILTLIAFISIVTAIFFAGRVRDFQDLSLNPNDIIITETSEEIVDLWIRQKNGIESVMITKQIIDYGTGTGHYTCLDPGAHLAFEGEKRLVEGVFFGADEMGYPLVDSTTEKHPRLGAAYHLRLPREILYQSGDGDYHALSLYHGSPFTITSFREDFADYTGDYRINPFTLHAEKWTSKEPFYGTYSMEVLAERLNEDVNGLEERLRGDFEVYQQEQELRLKDLRTEGVVVASDLQDKIEDLERRLRLEYAADLDRLYETAETVIEELQAADTFMKEEASRLMVTLYADLETALGTLETALTSELAELDSSFSDELAAYREEISTLIANTPTSQEEELPLVDLIQVEKIEDELGDLQKELDRQRDKLEAQYNSFTSYFETVNERLDTTEGEVSGLETAGKEQKDASDSMYIKIENVTQEVARLRNAVMMFNNMGVFGSIRPINKDAVKMIMEYKENNNDLTQQEALEALHKDGFTISSYEVFLIFSVYFNEYKL